MRAFAATARDGALRRVAIAFVAFNVAEWATWIAMLVYAYGQGGVVASGLIAVAQLVPAAIFAPIGAALADRYRRDRFLAVAYAAQAVAMGATATALYGAAPAPVVYVLAAVAATSITLTRPAQNGLLPALAATPDTLTAANAALGAIENASILVAPAFAGVLLSVSGPGFVFAVVGVWLGLSALLIAGLPATRAPAPTRDDAVGFGQAVRILAADRRSLLLVGLLAAQALQVGALDVLFVALALTVLNVGQTGVGLLSSAVGLGGVIGTVAAGALALRGSLPRWMAIGTALWGGGLVAVAIVPQALAVFALIVAAGSGRGLMDVTGRTLLQRVARADVLSRAFGVLEGLSMAALAIGSALAPVFVERFGATGAVAAVGVVLPLVVALTLRPLLRIDAGTMDTRRLELLRTIPLFAPLDLPTLERVASALVRVEMPSGSTIVREGDPGDRFYIIESGVVAVSIEGQPVRELGLGSSFGEIALLRDVPRTATVTARDRVTLYALERDEFLAAMRSHAASGRALEALAR